MTWIHIPHITSSTVSADTGDSASDSDSPTRTPSSGRSPISNGINIANESSKPGSKTATSMTLPSGTTSSPLTADPGVERWISSVLASRANRIQMLDSARAPMMTETSGPIPSESLAKWHQGSGFCWRTSQASLWELMDGHHMGAPWSESWPKSGICQNGELYPLPTLAPHTSGRDGGLWRTPDTADATDRTFRVNSRNEPMLSGQVKLRPTPVAPEVEKERRWHIPTPTSADVYTGNMESSQQSDDSMHSVSLPDFVGRFPTPVADGDRQTNYAQGGTSLGFAARMFPTPRAGKTTDEDEESWLARHAAGKVATPPLALAARMFPTPTTQEIEHPDIDLDDTGRRKTKDGRTGSEARSLNLADTARMLPTPSSGGDSGGPHGIRGGSWAKEKLVETFGEEDAVAMSGGSLSPDWVSWLMGLPVGWTSLEPLAQEDYDDWFQAQLDGTWWQEERGLPRIATGIKDRVNRLKCLGNGIVPASLALFLRGATWSTESDNM